MEHYVEKKGNVWIPRQEPINGRNIGHKVVCERLGAYEASEMTPGAVIAMKRACGGKTAAEIEALMQAESEGRIAPCTVGDTVYIVTKCEKIPTILDGTLYGSNGGPGTATGYYCPYEDNCPHDAQDCEPVKEQFAIFEDVIERVIFDEDGISVYSEYCCCNTLGEDAFLEKDKASATLAAKEGERE